MNAYRTILGLTLVLAGTMLAEAHPQATYVAAFDSAKGAMEELSGAVSSKNADGIVKAYGHLMDALCLHTPGRPFAKGTISRGLDSDKIAMTYEIRGEGSLDIPLYLPVKGILVTQTSSWTAPRMKISSNATQCYPLETGESKQQEAASVESNEIGKYGFQIRNSFSSAAYMPGPLHIETKAIGRGIGKRRIQVTVQYSSLEPHPTSPMAFRFSTPNMSIGISGYFGVSFTGLEAVLGELVRPDAPAESKAKVLAYFGQIKPEFLSALAKKAEEIRSLSPDTIKAQLKKMNKVEMSKLDSGEVPSLGFARSYELTSLLSTLEQFDEFVPLAKKIEALKKKVDEKELDILTGTMDMHSQAYRQAMDELSAKVNADIDALN